MALLRRANKLYLRHKDHFNVKVQDEEMRFKDGFESFLLKFGKEIVITDMEVSPGCPAGENFVAEISRVVVKGFIRADNKKEGYTESFIVKKVPGPESVNHKLYDCRRMCDNEMVGYEIIRNFQAFATSKNLNITCFAKYYGASYDFIALEDLNKKGYRMRDRSKGFDVQECLLILEKLSFFHAVSFAMKSTEGEKFREMTGRLREVIFYEEMLGGVLNMYWENAVTLAVKSLVSRNDSALLKPISLLKQYRATVFPTIMEVLRAEEPFDVICHGDLWLNNILLRYAEGEVIDAKMIDLQSMRRGSCVLDLMYLLFTSLETGLLKTSFNEIITFYYNRLVQHTRGFGCEIRFTHEELREEMRRKVAYGLFVACLFSTVLTKKASETSAEVLRTKEELSAEDEIERTYLSLNKRYHDHLYNLVTALMTLALI